MKENIIGQLIEEFRIWSFLYNKKTWMLKIKNTSEYNKTTDWQVSKNLIIQRGIYNEV